MDYGPFHVYLGIYPAKDLPISFFYAFQEGTAATSFIRLVAVFAQIPMWAIWAPLEVGAKQ